MDEWQKGLAEGQLWIEKEFIWGNLKRNRINRVELGTCRQEEVDWKKETGLKEGPQNGQKSTRGRASEGDLNLGRKAVV